jgi:hypothetical protein
MVERRDPWECGVYVMDVVDWVLARWKWKPGERNPDNLHSKRVETNQAGFIGTNRNIAMRDITCQF